jgi:hypothetical protein
MNSIKCKHKYENAERMFSKEKLRICTKCLKIEGDDDKQTVDEGNKEVSQESR